MCGYMYPYNHSGKFFFLLTTILRSMKNEVQSFCLKLMFSVSNTTGLKWCISLFFCFFTWQTGDCLEHAELWFIKFQLNVKITTSQTSKRWLWVRCAKGSIEPILSVTGMKHSGQQLEKKEARNELREEAKAILMPNIPKEISKVNSDFSIMSVVKLWF